MHGVNSNLFLAWYNFYSCLALQIASFFVEISQPRWHLCPNQISPFVSISSSFREQQSCSHSVFYHSHKLNTSIKPQFVMLLHRKLHQQGKCIHIHLSTSPRSQSSVLLPFKYLLNAKWPFHLNYEIYGLVACDMSFINSIEEAETSDLHRVVNRITLIRKNNRNVSFPS